MISNEIYKNIAKMIIFDWCVIYGIYRYEKNHEYDDMQR